MKFKVHVQGVSEPIEIERRVEPSAGNLLATLDDVARRGFVSDTGRYFPGRRVRMIDVEPGAAEWS